MLAGGVFGRDIGLLGKETYLRTTFMLDVFDLPFSKWETPLGQELPYDADLG